MAPRFALAMLIAWSAVASTQNVLRPVASAHLRAMLLKRTCLCKMCGSMTIEVKCFSFVDCPGHAELMVTMLAGASVFDAALLVAASNVPCPSPQAAAHVSALAVSGQSLAGRVAIVQSKADMLLPTSGDTNASTVLSQLDEHARDAANGLYGTDAAEALTFPVATPLGIGLDAIAMWLADLPERTHSAFSAEPQMHYLRSFDIHFPGTPAVQVKGVSLAGRCLRVPYGSAIPSRSAQAKLSNAAMKAMGSLMGNMCSLFSHWQLLLWRSVQRFAPHVAPTTSLQAPSLDCQARCHRFGRCSILMGCFPSWILALVMGVTTMSQRQRRKRSRLVGLQKRKILSEVRRSIWWQRGNHG